MEETWKSRNSIVLLEKIMVTINFFEKGLKEKVLIFSDGI
jgi:hypothetical protein